MTNLKSAEANFSNILSGSTSNPWAADDIDKMEVLDVDGFKKIVDASRFFYRHDSTIATTINKMIDIAITKLIVRKKGLSNNELRIINSILDPLEDFAENLAMEYLISGLVIPEVKYGVATKDKLKEYGIKKYEALELPIFLWVRDPSTVKINSSMVLNEPSYYVEIPEKLRFFITNGGMYPDGTKDEQLYTNLKTYYPEFVLLILNGEKYILLDNPLIFRGKYLSNSPYPIPYLSSVIEPLKHKRNLRRMDYSIASRVIGAIQVFKLGDKDFPITEDQSDQFESLREQMFWRGSGGRDVERIFQLFANHTLQIEWIYPPTDTLLNEKKYAEVNLDILFGLGFPRSLLIGENERTQSGDPELATLSPIRTMEKMRSKILRVITSIIDEVMARNNLKGEPLVDFEPINLKKFSELLAGLKGLYDTGNLSRDSYAKFLGYNYEDEADKREEEEKDLAKRQIPQFAPQPFSPQPGGNTPNNPNAKETPKEPQKEAPKDKSNKNTNN